MKVNHISPSPYSNLKTREQNQTCSNYQPKSRDNDFNPEKSITIKEASTLFIKGAGSHIKNTLLAIIQNPIKTISSIALTSAGIAMLPFLGISMTVGLSALSLGFLALSSFSLTKNLLKSANDFKNKNYDDLRNDIKNTGADSVDMILNIPFAKGAVKLLNRQIKYGNIKVNTELFTKVKNAKTVNDKIINLMKEQYSLTYNQIVKERGIKVVPKLQFVHLNKNMSPVGGWSSSAATVNIYENNMPFNLRNFSDIEERSAKIYLPYVKQCLSKIKINNLSPITDIAKTFKDFTNMAFRKFNIFSIDNAISHELTHMEQYTTIARTKGLGIDEIKPMNRKFYETVVEKLGKIKNNSKEANLAYSYVEARKNYVNVNPKNFEKFLKTYSQYRSNLLEKEAFKIGDDYVRFQPKLNNIAINEMALLDKEIV